MFIIQKTGIRKVVIACAIEVEDADGGTQSVAVVDPAVDVEHDDTDLIAYRDSFFDAKHLKFKDGEEPSWFSIQPLTRRQKEAADEMMPRKRAAWDIRAGLIDCHFRYVDSDGQTKDVQQPERLNNGRLGKMVTEGWMDKVNLPSELLHALSYMVRHISEATVPLSSGSSKESGG
jgi:hypothetical protein